MSPGGSGQSGKRWAPGVSRHDPCALCGSAKAYPEFVNAVAVRNLCVFCRADVDGQPATLTEGDDGYAND